MPILKCTECGIEGELDGHCILLDYGSIENPCPPGTHIWMNKE